MKDTRWCWIFHRFSTWPSTKGGCSDQVGRGKACTFPWTQWRKAKYKHSYYLFLFLLVGSLVYIWQTTHRKANRLKFSFSSSTVSRWQPIEKRTILPRSRQGPVVLWKEINFHRAIGPCLLLGILNYWGGVVKGGVGHAKANKTPSYPNSSLSLCLGALPGCSDKPACCIVLGMWV